MMGDVEKKILLANNKDDYNVDVVYDIDLTYITYTEYVNDKKNGFELKLCADRVITNPTMSYMKSIYKDSIRFIYSGSRISSSNILLYSVKRYKDDNIDTDYNKNLYLRFNKGLCEGDYREDMYITYEGYNLSYRDGELVSRRYVLKRVKLEENSFYVINKKRIHIKSRFGQPDIYETVLDIKDNIVITPYPEYHTYNNTNENIKNILLSQKILYDVYDYGVKITNVDNTFILELNMNTDDVDFHEVYIDFIEWLLYSDIFTPVKISNKTYDIRYLQIMNVNTVKHRDTYNMYFVDGLLNCDMIVDNDVVRYRYGEKQTYTDYEFLFNIAEKYLPLFTFYKSYDNIHSDELNISISYGDNEDEFDNVYIDRSMSYDMIKMKLKTMMMNLIITV